jgi:hypothetical protein
MAAREGTDKPGGSLRIFQRRDNLRRLGCSQRRQKSVNALQDPATHVDRVISGIKPEVPDQRISVLRCPSWLPKPRKQRIRAGRIVGGSSPAAAKMHPEDPGPFACPAIAGLVTAGGRLLLAMLHRLVSDRGGIIAACDTDGAHIVATEKGGTVHIETRGADFHEGGPATAVHALSWAEVEEIAARFEALNPFDRTLLPGSPLRVHRMNFDA